MFSNNMYKELEQLKARVGWLDHLDTEVGRRMHANVALLVEIGQLKAENKKLKESDRELKEEFKYILSNCQPLSVLSTQEKFLAAKILRLIFLKLHQANISKSLFFLCPSGFAITRKPLLTDQSRGYCFSG